MRPGSGGGRAVSRQTFVYDPTTAVFQREMHAVYRTLRDDHPVYASPDGTFVLSRFEDVWNAVNDWTSFSSAGVAEAAQLQPQMIYMDPPNHTNLRKLVSRAFTPKRVADLEPGARGGRGIAGKDGGGWRGRPGARVRQPPPEHGHQRPHRRTRRAPRRLPGLDRGVLGGDQSGRHRRPGHEYLHAVRIVAGGTPAGTGRRLDEQALLAAQVDGDSLSDDDLLGFCFLLLVAGNDTTTSLIGNGVELLARHKDQRAELAGDLSLVPAAVEEMLRVESPTQALPRTARGMSNCTDTPFLPGRG